MSLFLYFLILVNTFIISSGKNIIKYYVEMEKLKELFLNSKEKLIFFQIDIKSIKNKSVKQLIIYIYSINKYNHINAYLSLFNKYPSYHNSEYKIFSQTKLIFYLQKKEFQNIDKFYLCIECKLYCNFFYSSYGLSQYNLIRKTSIKRNLKPVYNFNFIRLKNNKYFNFKKRNILNNLFNKSNNEIIEDIKSGEEFIKKLKGQNEVKIFRFSNRNKNEGSSYVIDINILNCELFAKLNNRIITIISKNHQFIINQKDDDYNEEFYNIMIYIKTYINIKPKNYDYCLFQISGIEINKERGLNLMDGYSHIEKFNQYVKSLSYIYEFKSLKNETKQIYCLIKKKDKNSIYSIKYQINNNNGKDTEFLSNKKYLIFPSNELSNICKDLQICPLKIIITLKSEIKENQNNELEIEFLSLNNTPTYMRKDEVKYNAIISDSNNKLSNSKYIYYYQDINFLNNSFQYIFINFKRGFGSAIAKIIPKEIIEPNSNWNNRIKLPIKNSDNLTYYIPYDESNQMFKISENETKYCIKYNCEIYIGIYSNENENKIKLNEFSIHTGNYTSLKENELLYFSIEKEHLEQRVTFIVEKESDVVYINFNSDMCRMTIVSTYNAKAKFWKIDSSIQLFPIYANDTQFKLKSLKGLVFSLRVKSENNLNGFCKFSVKYFIPEKNYPEIYFVNTNVASIGKFNNNNFSFFIIPCLNIHNINNLTIYALNDNQMFSDDFEIYVNKMNLEDYYKLNSNEIKKEMPSQFNHQFSSSLQFNTDYLILNNINNEINDIVFLVSVENKNKIKSDSLIYLLTRFDDIKEKVKIEYGMYELVKIKPNEKIILDFGKNNKNYFVEFNLIEGNVLIENSKFDNERLNLMNNKIYGLFINPSNEEYYTLINKNNDYSLVYVKYIENDFKNTINQISYNKKNLIFYNNKYSKIKFPISFYTKIDNTILNKGNDIQIIIQFINQTIDNFNFISGLVDIDYINKLKYSNEKIIRQNISSENIFQNGLNEVRFIFNNSIIKNNIQKNNVFFISLNNEKDIYNNIMIEINILPINSKNDNILILPKDNYYFSNFDSGKTILKLKKSNKEDKTMLIEFSYSFNDNIIISINPENTNIDYYKNNSDLIEREIIKNGKSYIELKLDKFPNIKYIEFTLLIKQTNSKILKEKNNNNYYIIRYQIEKNLSFIIPEMKIKYSKENSIFSVSKILNGKNMVKFAIYEMNIYLEKEIKDKKEINSFYSLINPKYKFNPTEFSENEVFFKINNSIIQNQNLFISIIVTANYNTEQEILQYEILYLNNEIPNDKNKKYKNKIWIWILICFLLIVCILIFIIVFKRQNKNNILIDTSYNLKSFN